MSYTTCFSNTTVLLALEGDRLGWGFSLVWGLFCFFKPKGKGSTKGGIHYVESSMLIHAESPDEY